MLFSFLASFSFTDFLFLVNAQQLIPTAFHEVVPGGGSSREIIG